LNIQGFSRGTRLEGLTPPDHYCPQRREQERGPGRPPQTEKEPTVLNDTEVKRIIEAITEYRELVQQSTEMRDQLEALQKRWSSLRQEREALRTGIDSLHQTLTQMKVDYQQVMKRMTDLSATEDTVLDNVKFLIDELTSVLRKHETA
jgi:chromosome segregation ATPase